MFAPANSYMYITNKLEYYNIANKPIYSAPDVVDTEIRYSDMKTKQYKTNNKNTGIRVKVFVLWQYAQQSGVSV